MSKEGIHPIIKVASGLTVVSLLGFACQPSPILGPEDTGNTLPQSTENLPNTGDVSGEIDTSGQENQGSEKTEITEAIAVDVFADFSSYDYSNRRWEIAGPIVLATEKDGSLAIAHPEIKGNVKTGRDIVKGFAPFEATEDRNKIISQTRSLIAIEDVDGMIYTYILLYDDDVSEKGPNQAILRSKLGVLVEGGIVIEIKDGWYTETLEKNEDGTTNLKSVTIVDPELGFDFTIVEENGDGEPTPEATAPVSFAQGSFEDYLARFTGAGDVKAAELAPEDQPPPDEQPAEEIRASINNDDPYLVRAENNLQAMTGDELIAYSPVFDQGFDFTRYKFAEGEVTALTASSEILQLGEQRFVPYLNQDGKIVIWWNVEKGEMEHVASSEYIDPETGFKLTSYVAFDKGWVDEGKKRGDLDKMGEEGISKAIFEHVFTWNNIYANHPDFWASELKYDKYNISEYVRLGMTYDDLVNLHESALEILKKDILGGEITIPLNASQKVHISASEPSVLVIKINYKPGGESFGINDPFGFFGQLPIITAYDDSAIIQINADLNYIYFGWGEKGNLTNAKSPGGILVQTLRNMTVGNNISALTTEELYYSRSLSDLMVEALCGKDVITAYLERLAQLNYKNSSMYLDKRMIPHLDAVSNSTPTCLMELHNTN